MHWSSKCYPEDVERGSTGRDNDSGRGTELECDSENKRSLSTGRTWRDRMVRVPGWKGRPKEIN